MKINNASHTAFEIKFSEFKHHNYYAPVMNRCLVQHIVWRQAKKLVTKEMMNILYSIYCKIKSEVEHWPSMGWKNIYSCNGIYQYMKELLSFYKNIQWKSNRMRTCYWKNMSQTKVKGQKITIIQNCASKNRTNEEKKESFYEKL